MINWDTRWAELAAHIATWSKDRSTKVGSVIIGGGNQILTAGYNGFPRGVNDNIESRHERPLKYRYTEHAERNAIYNAARYGIRLAGTTIYTPYYPCTDCARGIIQSGITTVVTPEILDGDKQEDLLSRWGDDFMLSRVMFLESGLTVKYIR